MMNKRQKKKQRKREYSEREWSQSVQVLIHEGLNAINRRFRRIRTNQLWIIADHGGIDRKGSEYGRD